MFEVEMKFKVEDYSNIKNKLVELGFQPCIERVEVDIYYNAPDRDFAITDEALRFRHIQLTGSYMSKMSIGEIETSTSNILTYKGPKQGDKGKIRVEHETVCHSQQEADNLKKIIHFLGYSQTLEVRKKRTFYYLSKDNIEITLDNVDGLGYFIELEIKSTQMKAALAKIENFAKKLGLSNEERRSYLELLLEKEIV